ncbi:MAG: leucine--tRNA ligase [Candidatus Methanomethylicus sp.]|nr:leucine--tRNA ligase [Candidatus Methanomethylicus sp.]
MSLDFKQIEEKWQKRWDEAHIFEANPDPTRPKYYVTVAYPYPNAPQHIGHARTYALADVHARYMRMKGFNVLLPMGFHYTGTPILAMSKRVVAGDEEILGYFRNLYNVPEETIKTFDDPINIARHFHKDIKLGMQEMGFSFDWRREMTTIDPQYSKFIEWQFHTLYSKGYITRGAHPVGWCPSCRNPVGQHDTKGDMEPEVGEFTSIKFDLDGVSLPTATLRPETIFGVTNIWINPEAVYVETEVSGARIIISERACSKLCGQTSCINKLREFKGSEIIGKYAVNPMTGKKVPLLPANFVDPDNATGVVMSVPAHAPFDLLALEDLKHNPQMLEKFDLDQSMVLSLEPIPVVELEGYSEIPARDVISKMGVKNQMDPKAEDATKELYQKEFHSAKMRNETGKYSGQLISKAKEEVKKELISSGRAMLFYEVINGPVYCRCGSKIIVNLLSDQWFINYGDPQWKEDVRGHLHEMSLMPDDLRLEFDNVVDWLREKACARRSGLGTHLPWDKDWIIESLSDSTIYMAYYTISNLIKKNKLDASKLDDDVFNYIFLGKGNSSSLKIDTEIAEAMRKEFSYFYPLDSRHSGRDLVPNHLTFFVFNHVAVFPKEYWPRQIAVNGSVLMDGKKMSKSMGNIIPLHKAIKIYGADTLRVSILSASELLQDVDFSDTLAKSTKSKLQDFYALASSYADAPDIEFGNLDQLDRWMVSRVQKSIDQAACSMDCLRVREAIGTAFFSLQQDLQWYIRRRSDCCRDPKVRSIIKYVLNHIILMMAPFAPHLCEDLWNKYGNKGFISIADYPKSTPSLMDDVAEIGETMVENLVSDTNEIIKVTGIVPTKICYYTSQLWKWEAYIKTISILEAGTDPKQLIREAMKDPLVRTKGGDAAKFISSASQCIVTMPKEGRQRLLKSQRIDEYAVLNSALPFLSKYFKCPVEIYLGDSPSFDPKKKSSQATPLRPAIYVDGSSCQK